MKCTRACVRAQSTHAHASAPMAGRRRLWCALGIAFLIVCAVVFGVVMGYYRIGLPSSSNSDATVAPTAVPTAAPTAPTAAPTAAPTGAPTTAAPTTAAPTLQPTVAPTTPAPTTAAPTSGGAGLTAADSGPSLSTGALAGILVAAAAVVVAVAVAVRARSRRGRRDRGAASVAGGRNFDDYDVPEGQRSVSLKYKRGGGTTTTTAAAAHSSSGVLSAVQVSYKELRDDEDETLRSVQEGDDDDGYGEEDIDDGASATGGGGGTERSGGGGGTDDADQGALVVAFAADKRSRARRPGDAAVAAARPQFRQFDWVISAKTAHALAVKCGRLAKMYPAGARLDAATRAAAFASNIAADTDLCE